MLLHSFRNGRGGKFPYAGLTNVNGTLYGTTEMGGKNYGTVFSITTSGKETVVYRFKGYNGANPFAGLIDVKGTLYGTTISGGINGVGTVFSITTSGKETVLHSFGGSGDGANPAAGLINVNGTLYGTTTLGGAGAGTVFSITTSGKETVLYSFGGSGDGVYPYGRLINVNGRLYGTTYWGGQYCGASGSTEFGCGTVFSITTSGKETVLYRFKGYNGAVPYAGLINVNGTLYGTTIFGGFGGGDCFGGSNGSGYGCGTVFAITTSGKETVLYGFQGAPKDGAGPVAGLISVKGTLYGTTEGGGANNDGSVFKISTSGSEAVLHNFKRREGAHSWAGLTNVNGTLYGTTEEGGGHGDGTVFSLTP